MNSNSSTVIGETKLLVDRFDWADTTENFFHSDNGWYNTFIYGAILYVPATFLLRRFMVNRNPVSSSIIKPVLLLWNIWMTIFSLVGAWYTIPQLYVQLNEHSWSLRGQVCDGSCFDHPSALWVFIFNVTKMMEWVDTLFLILQKKPVIFLHWFHHICTMLYCWHATVYSATIDCSGWWFATMNLFVHTIMYGYYGMRSIYSMRKKQFQLFSPLYITILQILQMVVGVYITFISYIRCDGTRQHNFWGVVFAAAMYIIYFYLFFQLFVQKKGHSSSKRKSKKVE